MFGSRDGAGRPQDGAGSPGEYFATHPGAYALALAGAFGAALYAAMLAHREPSRRRAAAFTLLAVSTAVEGAGIVLARHRAIAGQSKGVAGS